MALCLFEDFITKKERHPPPIYALVYYVDMKALYVMQPEVANKIVLLQRFVK